MNSNSISPTIRDIRTLTEGVQKDLRKQSDNKTQVPLQYPELSAKVQQMLAQNRLNRAPSDIEIANMIATLLEQDEEFLKRMGLGRYRGLRAGWSSARSALRLAQKRLGKALGDLYDVLSEAGSRGLQEINDTIDKMWR